MRRDAIPMAGNRYGDATCIGEADAVRNAEGQKVRRRVLMLCDCGATYVTLAAHVRRLLSRRCRKCGYERMQDGRADYQEARRAARTSH